MVINSVAKAIDILELLGRHSGGLSLVAISSRLGVNVSTAHHLLATMRERSLVDQDPKSKTYRIGHGLLALASTFLDGTDLYTAGLDPIRALRDDTRDTAYLTILDGEAVRTMIEMLGSKAINCRRSAGGPELHSSASGKLLLAYVSDARRRELLGRRPLAKYTPNTITSVDNLETELDNIVRQGFSLDREENLLGVQCVAAPIFDRHGSTVGCASVVFARSKTTPWEQLIKRVRQAADQISWNLGYVKGNRAPAERRLDAGADRVKSGARGHGHAQTVA